MINYLIEKLDRYIKKYYKNLIIKGILYFFSIVGSVFLIYALLEYIGYFSAIIRGILLYSFIALSIFIFIKYITVPVFKLFKIGNALSHEEAAKIIGNHFKGIIDDKIVNSLQLYKCLERDRNNVDLLIAGINQKTENIKNVKFERLIKYKENSRYFIFALIPVLIITIIIFASPFILYSPAQRIIQYNTYFERPAPFSIVIKNESLRAFQNEDFDLKVKVAGDILPDKVKLEVDNVKYYMNKINNNIFEYSFNNVQRNKNFYISASGFKFGPYNLELVPRPSINNFTIKVESPAYTNIEDEIYRNFGDIDVPVGSKVSFQFNTRFTDDLSIRINDEYRYLDSSGKGLYKFDYRAYDDFQYNVYTSNKYTDHGDSLKYYVNVIPDQHPQINVNYYEDSVLIAHKFFNGEIKDDYGFDGLYFEYVVIDDKKIDTDNYESKRIDIDKKIRNQSFNYHLDLKTLDLLPGQSVKCRFVVFDNDQLFGPKKTKSRDFIFNIPRRDELAEQTMQDYKEINHELGSNISEVSESRDAVEELRRKLLNEETIGWEERDAFQELMDKHENIHNQLEDLSRRKKETEERYEQFQETDEDISKMQDDLDRLMDDAISDEMKELLDKIDEELDKLSRDEMYEMLEKMDFEFSHFENQLDRIQELFKILEFKNMLNESIERVDNMHEKQTDVIEDYSTNPEKYSEDAYEDQNLIKDQLDEVSELLKELEEKNANLKKPQNFPDIDDQLHNIDYDIQQSLEELINDNHENALMHQERSTSEMDQLANRLKNFQDNAFQEDLAEDARLLRQLLQNLIKSSFNQEDLIKEVKDINVNDPRYVELIQEQRNIIDDLEVVEDSLIAMSKRQIQIESFVTREIAEINHNIEIAINDLINRRRNAAANRQQFVMTHINNLALMLNESLQNMQMQMAMQMNDMSGSCSPGGLSIEDIIDMQGEANEMMEKLQDEHIPEEGEIGEMNGVSEQLARMAAQQEAVRNELRKLTEELKRDHNIGTGELEDLQRQMEQTELDIVKNQITSQTMIRQEDILTRLLEHEKAMMERELDDERVGEVPEFYELSNPEDFFKYNIIKETQKDELKIQMIELNRFYKNLSEQYFLNLDL